jgi:hypothetical protein
VLKNWWTVGFMVPTGKKLDGINPIGFYRIIGHTGHHDTYEVINLLVKSKQLTRIKSEQLTKKKS